ncbi:hypothetical protein Cni_G13818 [Canna indica]|uniref:Uncharacterized protein n=1 Tax=Canna indica TaxID=4628 RepID=A0AAQ3KAU6_9LILI|nr:hypothetical protein Cni_G13818 [Canna indica]
MFSPFLLFFNAFHQSTKPTPFFPSREKPRGVASPFLPLLIFPRTARRPPSYFSPAIIRLEPRKGPSPAIVVDAAAGTTCTATTESMAAKWAQKTVVIPPQKSGCHLITPKILREIKQDLSGFKCDLAHLFLQHTSASLTINENYNLDVQDDTETFLNRIVPEGRSAPWKHTLEVCAIALTIVMGKRYLETSISSCS